MQAGLAIPVKIRSISPCPATFSTGCTSFALSVNGVPSPATTIAIAPDATADACVQPGYTTDQLKKLDSGGTYNVGGFRITQLSITVPQFATVKSNSVTGAFTRITGFQLGSAPASATTTQIGSCTVSLSTSTGNSSGSGGTVTSLDAGAVSVTGPAGSSLSNTPLTKTENVYSLTSTEGISVPGQASFSLPAGTYSINGAGGADVGTFSTSITIGTPLTLTAPLPDTVTRSAGLTLNWTGGNATDQVEIIGGTSVTTGTGASAVTDSASFICLTTADQRTFTVPASVLTQLPAADTGSLAVASGVIPATFTASLKAGGNIDGGPFSSSSESAAPPHTSSLTQSRARPSPVARA